MNTPLSTTPAGSPPETANGQPVAAAPVTLAARCAARGIEAVDLTEATPAAEALGRVPVEVATRHRLLPLAWEAGANGTDHAGATLTVAMADPFDRAALGVVRMLIAGDGAVVSPVLAAGENPGDDPAVAVTEAIGRAYGSNVTRLIGSMGGDGDGVGDDVADADGATPGDLTQHLQALAGEPTVVNLVDLIIHEAIAARASDIHVEPFEKSLKIKYRVDGVLHEQSPPPKNLQPAIVSRLKIMGGMNIAERFVPQDGHIGFKTMRGGGEQAVDLRVATVPTVYGESVVLRILDRAAALIGLDQLGMPDAPLHAYKSQLEQPHGIVLVTGPTGSGKTTTLYASLNHLFSPELKILTIEDPVEYRLHGVNQIPVNVKRGLGFADGLRAILRQDPDVVMVGEIRDGETADIAIRTALTGHLVFSTLHTNDALGAVARLTDMGVEPFLIASSLRSIMAQRLVRRLCSVCRREAEPDPEVVRRLGHRMSEGDRFYEGVGCRACRNTGFTGRFGIFEVVTVNDAMREAVTRRAGVADLAATLDDTHAPMFEDGYRKAAEGLTTLGEVLRVCSG